MNWLDFETAFNEARQTINIADRNVSSMARMVAGRLKRSGVSHSVLCELKKELQDYNMHTGAWK